MRRQRKGLWQGMWSWRGWDVWRTLYWLEKDRAGEAGFDRTTGTRSHHRRTRIPSQSCNDDIASRGDYDALCGLGRSGRGAR